MPRVVLDDVGLNYEEAGEGTALVLIHGLGGDLHAWDADKPVLAAHHRVVRYDLRGFGGSDRGGAYSLDLLACDLDRLMSACGLDTAHVLGFSMGGAVALRLALSFPGRLRSLVLVSTSSEVGPAATAGWLRLADRVEREGFGSAEVEAARVFSPAFLASHREIALGLGRRYAATDPASYAAAARAVSSYNWTAALGQVSAPTLILQGLEDRVSPPGGSVKMKRALPQARLLMLGTGHSVPMEQPELFRNVVLAFTAGVDLGRSTREPEGETV